MSRRARIPGRVVRPLLISAAILLPPAATFGIPIAWDGNGAVPPSGTYAVANNWNPNQTPVAGDTVTFNLANTYAVTFGANAASDSVTVSAGTVSFVGTGPPRTYNLTTGAADLAVNGGTLNVGASFAPVALNVADSLSVGTSGNGTASVSGAGSALNASGTGIHSIGFFTSSGTLNYTNDSAGAIASTLNVGVSINSTCTGNLNVNTGADLDVGNLNIGTSVVSTATGTVSVAGVGSTLDMTGASILNIGSASANIGVLNVNNNGAFSTGTGAVTVNATGDINVDVGALNLHGNTTVNGGGSIVLVGLNSDLNLDSGRSMTIQNNGQVNMGISNALSGGTTWNVNSGGDLIGTGGVDIGTSGDNTVIVDGASSSLQGLSDLGRNGHTADVTIRNGATASTSFLDLCASGSGTTAILKVQSGATLVVSGSLLMNFGGGASATITVDGAGSAVTHSPSALFSVGAFGAATTNVQNGASFSAGEVVVFSLGQINIDGGSFQALGPITVVGGSIQQEGGSFAAIQDVTLQNGGDLTLGGSISVANQTYSVESGAFMTVEGTTTIQPTGRISIAGGTATLDALTFGGSGAALDLSSGTLNIPAAPAVASGFNWTGGTLHVTGAGGLTIGGGHPLGANVSLSAAQTLDVDNGTTINVGAKLQAFGPLLSGTLTNKGQLDGIGTAVTAAGASTNMGGAKINLIDTTLNLGSGANKLTNSGRINLIDATVNGDIHSNAGGVINTAGNVTFNGSITGSGLLDVDPGGVTAVAASGNRIVEVDALSLAADATLDLSDNDLIVDYTGASPAADIEALVASAYNVIGDWLGDGITSSVAAADGNFVVAIADNALLPAPFGTAQGGPLFAGQDVDLTTVLIKFTHRADINLDGVITPDDSAVFGGNYDENQPAVWATGDMDYNGIFTPDDAAIFGGAYDESLTSLPEPGTLGVLGAAGLLLARRLRRRFTST